MKKKLGGNPFLGHCLFASHHYTMKIKKTIIRRSYGNSYEFPTVSLLAWKGADRKISPCSFVYYFDGKGFAVHVSRKELCAHLTNLRTFKTV
jgi:hypothetical protein